MNDMLITTLVGLLCLFSSACVGWQQILLGPQAVNYPKAGVVPRGLMFVWCAALLFRGSDLLGGVIAGQPQVIGLSGLPASLLLAAVQASLLYNTMRQYLPASMWRKINRALDIAACEPWKMRGFNLARARSSEAVRPGSPLVARVSSRRAQAALAELHLAGIRVSAPGEFGFGDAP